MKRSCIRTLTCIDGICFDNAHDAAKFLMYMVSRRQPVTISHQTDTSACHPK